jgi:hypothetical protein
MKIFFEVCEKHNIVYGNDRLFEYMRAFVEKKGAQMELF